MAGGTIRPWGLPVLAGLVLAGGCSAYDTRFAYDPLPARVEIAAPAAPEVPAARVLVSVLGVHRADRQAGVPASMDVRLRVENTGPGAIAFDPASLVLLSADLREFEHPGLGDGEQIEVTADRPAVIDAAFPFPPPTPEGPLDLGGLHLQWTMLVDEKPVPAAVTLKRRLGYGYPYYSYCGPYYGGYGHGGYGHGGYGYGGYGYGGYGYCR